MYKRILVASDASEGALLAVKKAVELATSVNAGLVILYAYELPPFYAATMGGGMIDPFESVEPEVINEWVTGSNHTVRERTLAIVKRADIKYTYREIRGHPARTIARVAEEENCELIVVGSRGLSGITAMIGSVSERVAHLAHCSVLIVR